MKKCWRCAEEIQDQAMVCRYCSARQGKAAPQPSPRATKIGLLMIGGLFILGIINAIIPRDGAPVEPETSVPPRPTDIYGGCLLRGLGNQSQNFAGLVKRRLRNPDSFEHVETTPGSVENGVFPVTMTYRATNGFGGIDSAIAIGEVQVSNCAARIISIE